MANLTQLALASATFVGTHFLLSHPLRRPLVARLGEGPFAAVYSLVAFATLGWMVFGYLSTPPGAMLWSPSDLLWAIGSAVVLVASILLAGSLIGNPALPNPGADGERTPPEARGVFAVTRHPMLWSFALWGLAHMLVWPEPRNLVAAAAVVVLSLVGAALQDAKKARLRPEFWRAWEARTSWLPFAAIASGRVRASATWPGWGVIAGGTALWLVATWAHRPVAGIGAGLWRWIG